MSAIDDQTCPVCGSGAERKFLPSTATVSGPLALRDARHAADGWSVTCHFCGSFVVTYQDAVNLKAGRERGDWNPFHVSALLVEQVLSGRQQFWLRDGMDPYGPLNGPKCTPIDLPELLTRWPKTVAERLDRALCNLAYQSKKPGDSVRIARFQPNRMLFANGREEIQFHLEALSERGLIRAIEKRAPDETYCVTSAGWERFEQLTHGKNKPENPAFVAMWFGGRDEQAEMTALYNDGIYPAIVKAGFKANRVDLIEHNDSIIDEILAGIRMSPFVVADFTSHRNGVYFEAGFARGLGIPVIHTCRRDHLDRAHFDTAQLNHVVWATPAEMREKLYNRIVGSLGQGPFVRSGA